MADNPVFALSRQYGSGGREIGQMLARQLGVPYYDNELIVLAARQSGFDPELFRNADQNATNSLLFSLSMYGDAGGIDIPLGDRVFLIQSDIIRSVAEQGPCVIVGRCADYVLRERENCLSVFLHVPIQWRIDRAVSCYGLSPVGAKEAVDRIDRKRSVYYSHFTGKKWGPASVHSLSLDTSILGIEATADLLADFARLWSKR